MEIPHLIFEKYKNAKIIISANIIILRIIYFNVCATRNKYKI